MNDSLPKPVALIDSEGRLAGSGDYDVFGRVNEVTVSQDTPAAAGTPPQPFGAYLPSQNLVLAYLKQPATSSSLAVQLRVRYAAINTGSAGDFTWVEDGTTGAALTPPYQGWVLGEKTTPWLPVGAAGLVHVRWQSDGVGEPATYSGVTVGSYEYRRYEVGASPWWLPLRFPGQYADAESGLFENWNRFYEPSTGRYSAADEVLRHPRKTVGEMAAANNSVYSYTSNRPLVAMDVDGRIVRVVGNGRSVSLRLGRAIEKLKGTKAGAQLWDALEKSTTVYLVKEANLGMVTGEYLKGLTGNLKEGDNHERWVTGKDGTKAFEVDVQIDLANLDRYNKEESRARDMKAKGLLPDSLIKAEQIGEFESDVFLLGHELAHGPDFFDPRTIKTNNERKADDWGKCIEIDCSGVPKL